MTKMQVKKKTNFKNSFLAREIDISMCDVESIGQQTAWDF